MLKFVYVLFTIALKIL